MNNKPLTPAQLDTITGGVGQTVQPLQPTQPSGMAPPKYSAGWWDFVRNNGGK